MIKQFIRESVKNYLLNEIDWQDTFSDVQKTCVDPKEFSDYLNKVKANADKGYGEREKFKKTQPYVHAKSRLFAGSKTKVNLDLFIKQITTKPNTLISQNEKMTHTGEANTFVYNTGIPAFRGIAYDIEKDKFYYINTCPGAGTCVTICYALKGNYIRYPGSYDNMTRRLNLLLNYPDKFEEQLYSELKAKCVEHKAIKGYKFKVSIRWNDSGDFFTKKYVEIAHSVIDRLRSEGYNIEEFLHTKIASVAQDTDFDVTSFSMGGNKKELAKIGSEQKISDVVGKSLFTGLDLNKLSDIQKLKELLAMQIGVNKKFILTYDELMQTPVSKKPKWYTITTPGDGDDATRRKDVIRNFQTEH
jgi:hypothetical protein